MKRRIGLRLLLLSLLFDGMWLAEATSCGFCTVSTYVAPIAIILLLVAVWLIISERRQR